MLALLLLASACRTILPDAVASWASSVTAAKHQSNEAFQAVNSLIADASLDYAASQTHLTEENLTGGLPSDSLLLWDQALDELERYARHLQQLTSPDLAKPFEDQAQVLGTALQDFGRRLKTEGDTGKAVHIDPGLAAGFTELGSLIIRLKAQSDARKTASKADPVIQQMLSLMADSVGSSSATGMRATVKGNWNQLLAAKKVEFMTLTNKADKRRLAVEFLGLMKRREAQDLVLASLRRSLLGLADLHHALAMGQVWNAQTAAAAISSEIRRTKEIHDQFKETLGQEP